jgi:hypothetical protein
VYNFSEYLMAFLIFALNQNGARRTVFNGFPFSSANPTFINLFSNLISQIQNFPIQNQQSLNIFLATDRKMCFFFVDTLRSLSFARR